MMKTNFTNDINNNNEMINTCEANTERSGKMMKGFFKKIKVLALTFTFLGATGAGIATVANEPVMAAEASVNKIVVKNTTKTTVAAKRPLKSITLNATSINLQKGRTYTLKVSYNPLNTTDSKNVKWTTGNAKVATVSNGYVVAKGTGSTTVTAVVNGKKATCTVKVTAPAAPKEKYWNVSQAYTLTNQFRTTRSNQWYWNKNNKTKTTTYGLKALKRDVALENVAKKRAKEQWTQYYVNKKVTHDRPNGSKCWTAYPAGTNACAENLGWGHKDCRSIILDGDYGWAETNVKYEKQGHRRNLLSSEAKRVGIACYEKDGKTCWAMCLGR